MLELKTIKKLGGFMESNIETFMRTCNFIYAFHNPDSICYSYTGMYKHYNKMCQYAEDKHDLLLINGYRMVDVCSYRKIYCKNVDIEKVVIETHINIIIKEINRELHTYTNIKFINKENSEYTIVCNPNDLKISEYDNAIISVLLNDSEINELKNYLSDIEILVKSLLLAETTDSINLEKEISLRR